MMKIVMTLGIYVGLVAVLGAVLALTLPRDAAEPEPGDDEG